MLSALLPKEFKFFDFFESHMVITKEICAELKNLTLHPEKLEESAKKISKLEHDADDIIHICTEALHKTFITPIERTDIFALIKQMDDIADNIKTAVSRMKLYEINDMREEAVQMADILIIATNELEIAIKGLRNMKKPDIIKEKCNAIHKLEHDADDILRNSISRLFKENDTILIIKWKEVFERLEKAVDRCEGLANVIEGILIDNA